MAQNEQKFLTELVNPKRTLRERLITASHQVVTEFERTCTSDTCGCYSHDSGYTAAAVTPAIEVLASEYWPGEETTLELWKLQGGAEVVVVREHGNASSFGAVRLLEAPSGRPCGDLLVEAQEAYKEAVGVHADLDLAEADEDGRGGGYWTCGAGRCGREPDYPVELVLDRLYQAADRNYGVEP